MEEESSSDLLLNFFFQLKPGDVLVIRYEGPRGR